MERKCFHIFILLYFSFSKFPTCKSTMQLPSIVWDPWNPIQVQIVDFLSLSMLWLELEYCSKYFPLCTNTYINSCYNCEKIKTSIKWSCYQMFRRQAPVQRFPKIFPNIYKEFLQCRIGEFLARTKFGNKEFVTNESEGRVEILKEYTRFNTELQGKYWWHVMCCNATYYW